jgi:hypothetical protein
LVIVTSLFDDSHFSFSIPAVFSIKLMFKSMYLRLFTLFVLSITFFSNSTLSSQNLRWVQSMGGASIDYFTMVNTDPMGNAYVVGSTRGVSLFGAINYGVQG